MPLEFQYPSRTIALFYRTCFNTLSIEFDESDVYEDSERNKKKKRTKKEERKKKKKMKKVDHKSNAMKSNGNTFSNVIAENLCVDG